MRVSTLLLALVVTCVSALAVENGPLLAVLQPNSHSDDRQIVYLQPSEGNVRQKRSFLLGAGILGAGVIGAGVLGAGLLGAGVIGAKAGLIGGALAGGALGARSYGGYHGYGGHYGGHYGGYYGHGFGGYRSYHYPSAYTSYYYYKR